MATGAHGSKQPAGKSAGMVRGAGRGMATAKRGILSAEAAAKSRAQANKVLAK